MFPRIKKFFTEYKNIKYLAYHDSLTGLLNRNWLYKNIDNIDRIYVYFIDINDLKEKNKNGHTHGDEHIKYVVNVIKKNLKEFDIFIRYAGDEFIVFSNNFHAVKASNLYTIGKTSLLDKDIREAIKDADKNMIIEKNERKFKYGTH